MHDVGEPYGKLPAHGQRNLGGKDRAIGIQCSAQRRIGVYQFPQFGDSPAV